MDAGQGSGHPAGKRLRSGSRRSDRHGQQCQGHLLLAGLLHGYGGRTPSWCILRTGLPRDGSSSGDERSSLEYHLRPPQLLERKGLGALRRRRLLRIAGGLQLRAFIGNRWRRLPQRDRADFTMEKFDVQGHQCRCL